MQSCTQTTTYVCTYVHVYTYICTHIHTYVHTNVHTYIHMFVHTYTCIHTYICTHTYIRPYIHMYTRTYVLIHTSVHTHTHLFCTRPSITHKRCYSVCVGSLATLPWSMPDLKWGEQPESFSLCMASTGGRVGIVSWLRSTPTPKWTANGLRRVRDGVSFPTEERRGQSSKVITFMLQHCMGEGSF